MNLLSKESSPYLLQHKDNPVHWMPWGEEAFEKAKNENKIVLVSVGYSACHWCHVMEHESFESEEVAEIMNQHFICVKVDREERPDVDKSYMEAVQLMNRQGGWPLNCFTLPNKQPFYGGTYFPKDKWIGLLNQIQKLWNEQPDQVLDFSQKVTAGVAQGVEIFASNERSYALTDLVESMGNWISKFDEELGGFRGAPKFPLPGSYEFLLAYGAHCKDVKVLDHVHLTLTEMYRGGIYDQVGGGFARYSVDDYWKVPHFEKMLYDNAQLLSLYAKGASFYKEEEFKEAAKGIAHFIMRELYNAEEGLFYSALDADSEGVEGKYYVWSLDEIQEMFEPEDLEKIKFYYNFNAFGEWEGNYIPLRQMSDHQIAKEWKITTAAVKQWRSKIDHRLFEVRKKRVRPGLDDKILCSWNALTIVGLLEASSLEIEYEGKSLEQIALSSLAKLMLKMFDEDSGVVCRTFRNNQPVNGFLDDYAWLIKANLLAFQKTGQEQYANDAKSITDLVLDKFFDNKLNVFSYSPLDNLELFAKQSDFVDDVIPSSVSTMVKNLYMLALVYGNTHYQSIVEGQLRKIAGQMEQMPYNFSNWAEIFVWKDKQQEVVIIGENAKQQLREFQLQDLMASLVFISTNESGLPIFQSRFREGETRIFVCTKQTCAQPVTDLDSALSLIKGN